MGPTVCMNVSCGSRTAIEWKKGWVLRSGGFANLCDKCGSAYDQLIFCDTFHFNESGWRQCIPCGKRLHCGCIASKSLFELLDVGGVECISCVRKSEISSIPSDACQEDVLESSPKAHNVSPRSSNDDKASRPGMSGNLIEQESSSADSKMDENTVVEGCSSVKREQDVLPLRDVGATTFLNPTQPSTGPSPSIGTNRDNATKEFESIGSACLNISLGTSHLNFSLPIPSLAVEGREMNKVESSFHQGQRSGHLLLKPPKLGLNMSPETSKDGISHIRFLRPPGEGKGRNQLLPRYWPRITDQELQQISGGSNSTILPLFEKVLSASDAGRIGRLVLPKACAEAYFPPISQPEGLPLKVQDAKGKDWVFQFRFWPNNNSRMYVLEGVTPCIQSMQLQAGDTVTFSRIEPEGKLLMGFRKASYSLAVQDTQVPVSACPSGALPKESFFPGGLENLPNIHGYSGVLQSLKGNVDPQLSLLSGHLKSLDGDIRWLKPEKNGGRLNDGFPFQLSVPVLERTRKIGSKSKRLHIDSEDAMELKLTWEEVQDLLRPPSSVKPSIVVVEDHAFEEYEEPPVYGKATIFTARLSGEQDQWAQCDSCYKWRRLPVDVLLPARWTCADNMWDPKRCSCSVVDETGTKELENLLRMNMDFRKRKITGSQNPVTHIEPQPGSSRVVPIDDGNSAVGGPTTKHPRHRPGCMCIVCIQPPSGKGPKHKPTCTCNVCMTVKRRFKTLMMRRKKRQLEREAETANKKQMWSKDETEIVGSSRRDEPDTNPSKFLVERVEMGKGGIDLNCHPDREKAPPLMPGRVSMTNLLQEASLPLEAYLRQNGLTTLICEQQVSSSSPVLPQLTGENEGQATDGSNFTSSLREREGVGD